MGSSIRSLSRFFSHAMTTTSMPLSFTPQTGSPTNLGVRTSDLNTHPAISEAMKLSSDDSQTVNDINQIEMNKYTQSERRLTIGYAEVP